MFGGAIARSGVDSRSELAAGAATYGALLMVGTIGIDFLYNDLPESLSERIADRSEDYRSTPF